MSVLRLRQPFSQTGVGMEPHKRIILACDVSTLEELAALISELKDHVGLFKIGLQLLTSCGAPDVVRTVVHNGGRIMFDGKFSDIPNTMAGAVSALTAMDGIDFFTLHASCGRGSLLRVAETQGSIGSLAVTVLTSMTDSACAEVFGDTSGQIVPELARLAKQCGITGLVCSPLELQSVRDLGLTLVIPGIRPTWAQTGDQARVMTPREAISDGADYLVIGRPIREAPKKYDRSRAQAAKDIAEEIRLGLEDRQSTPAPA